MPSPRDLNLKGQLLLKSLVERYIQEGQPIGSKTLAQAGQLQMSPATIRNIMADLEERGFVAAPHTSAGRIPTAQGYRFFVDSLLSIDAIDKMDLKSLKRQLDPDMTAQELVESASGLLSEVTQLAGIVTLPRRDQNTLRHLEFLPLNDNRVLVILVLDDHEVQNRVIYTKEPYNEIQLREAANFINQSFMGRNLALIREQIIASMKTDKESMNSLMQTTLDVAEQAFSDDDTGDYVMAGQENLIDVSQNQGLGDIRELFKAFSLKGDILHLLDRCMETSGMQLFIGQESGYEMLDECSLVTSSYHVEGELVGVLGVVGPTRMAYNKVIPIVDATAKLLSAALNNNRSKIES